MNSTLTAGQQSIMDMYTNEIARAKRYISQAETAWIDGTGSYEEIRYQRDELATLEREQRETLAGYDQATVGARGDTMKRVTKKERQLYDLLEQVSGLLSEPEMYGMRAYWAMAGTEARKELDKKIEAVLEPYRELRYEENQEEYQYPD